MISLLFPDLLATDPGNVEDKTIVLDRLRTHFLEKPFEVGHGFTTALRQQINVQRRTMRQVCPKLEQHGTLEHELFPMRGHAQAIQQPFDAVSNQNKLEFLAPLMGKVEQPLPYRRSHIGRGAIFHAIASM